MCVSFSTLFIFISKNVLLRKKLSHFYYNKHKITWKNYKELCTNIKRGNETKNRIAIHKAPNPWPIKKSSKECCFQLRHRTFHIFKRTTVTLPPNEPHQTKRNEVPNVGWVLSQPIPPSEQQLSNRPKEDPLNPKSLQTRLHGLDAISQWSSKWATISPPHQHIQHQPTTVIPLLEMIIMGKNPAPCCCPNK